MGCLREIGFSFSIATSVYGSPQGSGEKPEFHVQGTGLTKLNCLGDPLVTHAMFQCAEYTTGRVYVNKNATREA